MSYYWCKKSPIFSIYSWKLNVPLAASVPLMSVWLKSMVRLSLLLQPIDRTHFCRKFPMNSCRPMRANTLRQKTVRIMTSASFFTDWIKAPTMVLRPGICSSTKSQLKYSQIIQKNINVTFWLQVSSIHISCSHVKWHAVLTWNYSYCFQGPKNTESP